MDLFSIIMILVVSFCYSRYKKTKNWLQEQKDFYLTRTFYWTRHPEECPDRIIFRKES